ncbi:MAG: malonyl-CoA synthase [Rhodospirillales bacterium]
MTNVLYDGLFAGKRDSDAPLLILADGKRLSYRQFLDLAARFANTITEQGLQPGDRLAMQVPKSAEALAVYVACIQAGVILLPLNTAYTPDELDYFAGNAEPGLVLCDPKSANALAPVAEKNGARLLTLDGTGDGTFIEAAKGRPETFDPVARGADDLAALLYTSGTTGRSKGAMLSHGNLLSNAEALTDIWRFTADDVLLHALPIFHTHGLFVATNITFLAGGSMIFLPAFKTDEVIARLPGVTSMMGVPTFYTRLLDDDRLTVDLVGHIRLFTCGSAPLLAETHDAFAARTGHRILERYGMTETNMITSNPYDGARRAGYVGFPLPGVEVRVADPETGKLVANGDVGMIEVRGPNVFQGYWKMPEKTDEEFRDDGFFVTGDMGRIDEEGYVQIIGRSKDLIISGGYNIYPKEIELLIDEQEGVRESAVIGVPHPDFGEGVVGVVVAENGADIDVENLMETIRPKIARFKQPKAIFVVDELPRNTMGKVQKAELRSRYNDLFADRR